MIRSISGSLIGKEHNFAVVDVGGIGFKVFLTLRTQEKLPTIGEKVVFVTHLNVKEDALDLYGFINTEELKFFEALLSVSGVGPRSAMAVLAVAPVEELISAIARSDYETLNHAVGIGKKTAERIVLELKDKMKLISTGIPGTTNFDENDDVYEALRSLGYSANQVKTVVSKIDPEIKDLGAKIRDALKKIKS